MTINQSFPAIAKRIIERVNNSYILVFCLYFAECLSMLSFIWSLLCALSWAVILIYSSLSLFFMGHKINVLAFVRISENWKSFGKLMKDSKACWGMKYFKNKMLMNAGREEILCLVTVNMKVFLGEKPLFWKSRLWNKKKN